jgi:exportin-5
MLSCLGSYLDRKFSVASQGAADIDGFLHLLLLVVQSPSLVVSIPALVTWVRLLNNKLIGPHMANSHLIGPLLENCCSRLIRYENLPEDTREPTYLFLSEDTDTIPERHAFLGNYRRYSSQVIELVVQLKLSEAIYHVLGQAENMLQHLYDGQPPLDPATYNKDSMPVLRVDAHFTVIESALKGYMKWRISPQYERVEGLSSQSPTTQQKNALETNLETWCNKLLEMNFEVCLFLQVSSPESIRLSSLSGGSPREVEAGCDWNGQCDLVSDFVHV